MTPDKPITVLVAITGATLCAVLPRRWAMVPLALSLCLYPSDLLLPPDGAGMTAQRIIGLVLFIRCICSRQIRETFKWMMIDTVALGYFLLLLVSQLMTNEFQPALVNRAGFFLSAMVPFWCVRFLIIDRESFYAFLKGWLWAALPLAFMGLYYMKTGNSLYHSIHQYGLIKSFFKDKALEQRPFMGMLCYRSSGPFMECIMFGWFFAILLAPGTNLYFEKNRAGPWMVAWMSLPLGIISTVSGGPMMMGAASMGLMALFPFRRYGWGMVWTVMSIGIVFYAAYFGGAIKRTPMEILANQGMDANSSWYRVGLQDAILKYGAMTGHWLAGYGAQPEFPAGSLLWKFHDLCIHWVSLLVFNGLMGIVGFYGLIVACMWNLFKAKAKATTVGEQWLLWSLMSVMLSTLFGMMIVALFSEMYYIYHIFLGLVANASYYVGARNVRQVGMLAEMNGQPVMVRYTLKAGQRLAIVQPAAKKR